MTENMIRYLSTFDQALFPNERSEILAFDAKMPESLGSGGLSYVSDAQVVHANVGHLLSGRDLPAGKTFFLIFSKEIVESVIPGESEALGIDGRVVFWAICAGALWLKVRNKYINELLMRLEGGHAIPMHFLTADEIAEVIAPYMKCNTSKIESNMAIIYDERWHAHDERLSLMLKADNEISIRAFREEVECMTIGSFAPWCKTEENAFAFLHGCKKVLWSRL